MLLQGQIGRSLGPPTAPPLPAVLSKIQFIFKRNISMKPSIQAGQKPAQSRRALQAQSRSLRVIAVCPLCNWGRRTIAVDARALLAIHASHPNGLHVLLHQRRELKLFTFGEAARPRPCEHFLFMSGTSDCWSDDGSSCEFPGSIEFDFDARVISDRQTSSLEEYLTEYVIRRRCGRQFIPQSQTCCRKANRKWREPADKENPPRNFHVVAKVFFATNPTQLFRELAVSYAEFQKHVELKGVAAKQ